MPPANTSEEMRELNASSVFELVTNKLKEDFNNRPKSLADLKLRYEKVTNDEDHVSKAKSYQGIIKDLFTMQHRSETTLAASLSERDKLGQELGAAKAELKELADFKREMIQMNEALEYMYPSDDAIKKRRRTS
jgi:chorismate mutase